MQWGHRVQKTCSTRIHLCFRIVRLRIIRCHSKSLTNHITFNNASSYLHRPGACVSENERIIGSSTFGCETNIPSTQALFLISSGNVSDEHTMAFYDDKDLLTNFRKYPVSNESQRFTDEIASEFAFVSNPNGSESINIGRICYKPMLFDGAVQLSIHDILFGKFGVLINNCGGKPEALVRKIFIFFSKNFVHQRFRPTHVVRNRDYACIIMRKNEQVLYFSDLLSKRICIRNF